MNPETKQMETSHSPVRPKWFLRVLRGGIILTLGGITLLALVVAIENYRGRRAWNEESARLVSMGEPIHLQDILPPEIPDDQNFAAQPLILELFEVVGSSDSQTARLNAIKVDSGQQGKTQSGYPNHAGGDWETGRHFDGKLLADFYREHAESFGLMMEGLEEEADAQVILNALDIHSVTLKELESYMDRPQGRYPIRYQDLLMALLPHLSGLKAAVLIQTHQAKAYLDLKLPDEALARLKPAWRIQETLASEPLLISQLVRNALLSINLGVIWEGWSRNLWQESHLRQIDLWLSQPDLSRSWALAMRGERTFGLEVMSPASRKQLMDGSLDGMVDNFPGRWIPSGWWDQNRVQYSRYFERMVMALQDPETGTFRFGTEHYRQAEKEISRVHPYRFFVSLLLPAVSKATEQMADRQTALALARAAVKVSLHRSQTGSWPSSLEEVSQQDNSQIFRDPCAGSWVHYLMPSEDSQGSLPVFYGVGINQKDDGGVVVVQNPDASQSRRKRDQGDLVWAAEPVMEEVP